MRSSCVLSSFVFSTAADISHFTESSVESALAKLKETLALVQDQHVEGQVEVTTRIAEVSALIDGFDMKPDFGKEKKLQVAPIAPYMPLAEKLGSAVDVVSGSVADVATSLMEQSETQQQQLTGAVEQLNASFAAEVHKSEEVVMK